MNEDVFFFVSAYESSEMENSVVPTSAASFGRSNSIAQDDVEKKSSHVTFAAADADEKRRPCNSSVATSEITSATVAFVTTKENMSTALQVCTLETPPGSGHASLWVQYTDS